jgi:hypothetical protein
MFCIPAFDSNLLVEKVSMSKCEFHTMLACAMIYRAVKDTHSRSVAIRKEAADWMHDIGADWCLDLQYEPEVTKRIKKLYEICK